MPEYLTPGVYLEETSFRSSSIEGVATSTLGMTGLTRYGPVPYNLDLPNGPVFMVPTPTLVTSFTEFERAFGSLGPVGTATDTTNYLAYAARAFFDNGGRRLYVQRVFPFTLDANSKVDPAQNLASLPVGAGANPAATWRTRWPGDAGKEISVSVSFKRSKNIATGGKLVGVGPGAAVEFLAAGAADPVNANGKPAVPAAIRIVDRDAQDNQGLMKTDGSAGLDPIPAGDARHISLTVTVEWGDRTDIYPGLEVHSKHPRWIGSVLSAVNPADDLSLVWLDAPNPTAAGDADALFKALVAPAASGYLTAAQGIEGGALDAAVLQGEAADPDSPTKPATGLYALAEIEDIAIVACPDTVRLAGPDQQTAIDNLIVHAEAPKAYRIAVVDPPKDSSISEVRRFRGQFDSKYAALYYPWVRIVNPTVKPDPTTPPATLDLPPSGFATGIYARSDIDRGVHKAPANEVVHGITQFVTNVTYDRQSVLNPEGINALRFFPGRSNRVWGARTMSSDPQWKYVNVRRLFNYMEHSIDRATQWAVFEPNNERLWASIRQSVEDFLVVTWRTGALMGTKPEEAFFVRCDRTTMSQNDLDNGRLICLIGVAPTYPAEFVIFRIGQWTADSQQS